MNMITFVEFRKPCSVYKMKEIKGSAIFTAHDENSASETGSEGDTPDGRARSRMYKVCGIS